MKNQITPDVSAVRARYMAALQNGASIPDATEYANAADQNGLRRPGKIDAPGKKQKQQIASAATVVEIPENWADLHYNARIKIAKKIDVEFTPDAADKSGSINRTIEAELARRAAA